MSHICTFTSYSLPHPFSHRFTLRYGQTKPTFCYRLLAEGSMEQKIYSRAAAKTSLSELVIDQTNPERSFTKNEMDLLRIEDNWVGCKFSGFLLQGVNHKKRLIMCLSSNLFKAMHATSGGCSLLIFHPRKFKIYPMIGIARTSELTLC